MLVPVLEPELLRSSNHMWPQTKGFHPAQKAGKAKLDVLGTAGKGLNMEGPETFKWLSWLC